MIKLQHAKGPDAIKTVFDTKLSERLALLRYYIQDVRSDTVIMPKESAGKYIMAVSSMDDIPKYQFVLEKTNTSRLTIHMPSTTSK